MSSTPLSGGCAIIGVPLAAQDETLFLAALNFSPADKMRGLPLQLISTGLPYLIVPIRSHLDQARIVVADFASLLARVGAKFVYVLDVNTREGRTWDNDGRVEDIATGSAVGPVAAYLVQHQLAEIKSDIVIQQGRFLQRPSFLHAPVDVDGSVQVSGQVCLVGSGELCLPVAWLLDANKVI